MTISVVPPHQVDQVWGLVAEGLQEACLATGGDITAGDLWVQCRGGSAFLIVVHDGDDVLGASVWRSETWATGQKLRCLALCGTKITKWFKPFRDVAVRLAKDVGATAIVTEGLEKWEPFLKRFSPNAKPIRILYEEELT